MNSELSSRLQFYKKNPQVSQIGLFQKKNIHTPSTEEINNAPSPLQTFYTNLRHFLEDSPPPSLNSGNFLCGWDMEQLFGTIV